MAYAVIVQGGRTSLRIFQGRPKTINKYNKIASMPTKVDLKIAYFHWQVASAPRTNNSAFFLNPSP